MVTRGKDGCLTDGKKTIRYGDLVRVPGGRIGMLSIRASISMLRSLGDMTGRLDVPTAHRRWFISMTRRMPKRFPSGS